ncbi:MAG: 50S ribosomal protein L25/general stress protein Ctc [Flavobacteriaceae bacterium]|nr:50S ribosomal protein L25/general stress protein Ctc [Flavobacteriaceae bacterium]
MQAITIKGSERESVGKLSTKALRNAEKVPCVLYGGEKPIHFSADELSFKGLVYTSNAHTVVIELEGHQPYEAVLQDIQFHPVTDRILHIDFFQLFEDKAVSMNIPVRLEGNSPGVRNGGRLLFRNRKLTVRALPANLPDAIMVDISKLRIGGTISVGDVKTEEYTFLHPDNTSIVQVKASRNAVADDDEDEEEGAEGAEAAATPAAE